MSICVWGQAHVWGAHGVHKRASDSLGLELHSCELPAQSGCGRALQELQVPSTAESSLQPKPLTCCHAKPNGYLKFPTLHQTMLQTQQAPNTEYELKCS